MPYRYVHLYGCHIIMCFDGRYCLILRFDCTTRAEIQTCVADCWVLPVQPQTREEQGFISIRRAYYQAVRDQYNRRLAETLGDSGTWFLENSYYFTREVHGREVWVDRQGNRYAVPPGVQKKLNIERRSRQWMRVASGQLFKEVFNAV